MGRGVNGYHCPSAADTACSKTVCTPKTGQCAGVVAPDNSACDDSNLCTKGEVCAGGQCGGGTNTCGCESDQACASQDDGDLCNGVLFCNKQTGKCELNPATVVKCPSVDDSTCQKTACQPKSGKCETSPVAEGKACDDGKACTVSDVCLAGSCKPGANVCACQQNGDCAKFEDGDQCNGTLYCDKQGGNCLLNPGSFVTCPNADDTFCLANQCQPKTGQCKLVAAHDAQPCNDLLPCTTGEVCAQGQCTPSANVCACSEDAQCLGKGDGDLCKGPLFCDKATGTCKQNPAAKVVCGKDGDTACSKETCLPATGKCKVLPVNDGAICDDGKPCVVAEKCKGGACKSGTVLQCDDGNQCTLDVCVASAGCVHIGAFGAGCDDGDACSVKDACIQSGGVWKCSFNDTLSCNKGNPCTDFACDKVKGCTYTANSAGCSDGNPCTEPDTCALAKCEPGKPKLCDDANGCTADSCESGKGCVYLPAGVTCSDGNGCTLADACEGASCKAGAGKVCDDGDACTTDVCDPGKGGACTAKAVVCDDQHPCTSDGCDKVKGCGHVAVADGTKCAGGACKAGWCEAVWVDVCAGYASTCAVRKDGTVWCWGAASYASSDVPKQRFAGGAVQVGCGAQHACLVTDKGELWCWGSGGNGTLGTGNEASAPSPVLVDLDDVIQVAPGYQSTCAVTATGSVWCWGSHDGPIGTGSPVFSPNKMKGLTQAAAVAVANQHACAARKDGSLWCWGKSNDAEHKAVMGSATESAVPVQGIAGVVGVAVNPLHWPAATCVLRKDLPLVCAGSLSGVGIDSTKVPTTPSGFGVALSVAPGGAHLCALTPTGSVTCAGHNMRGESGAPETGLLAAKVGSATAVPGLASVQQIVAGAAHTCARTTSGTLHCWGDNASQQLGFAKPAYGTLVAPSGLPPLQSLTGSSSGRPCGIDAGGTAWCWGGGWTTTPAASFSGTSISVSGSGTHACAIRDDGTGWCMGYGTALGNGNSANSAVPVQVTGLTDGVQVVTGVHFTCVRSKSGAVHCWGHDNYGQLGDVEKENQLVPKLVKGLAGVVELAAADNHACARTDTGAVLCWGYNPQGQVKAPKSEFVGKPTVVAGIGPALQVALATQRSCARAVSGAVQCWGDNTGPDGAVVGVATTAKSAVIAADDSSTYALDAAGQVWRTDSNNSKPYPDKLIPSATHIVSIRNGLCALTKAGGVLCWGDHGRGALGDGTAWTPKPTPVMAPE